MEPHLAILPELASLSARRIWLKLCHQPCHAGRVGRTQHRKRLLAIDEERLLPAPDHRNLLQTGEQVGTSLRQRRIARVSAWQRCPATLLDEGPLLPRTGLHQLGQVHFRIRIVLEFVDAGGARQRTPMGSGG
jgi:hypothetical protein